MECAKGSPGRENGGRTALDGLPLPQWNRRREKFAEAMQWDTKAAANGLK